MWADGIVTKQARGWVVTVGPVVTLMAGVVLLLLVVVDLAWTTLGVSHGAGPVTSMVLRIGWWAGRPFRQRGAHLGIGVTGVATVLATLVVWVVMIWGAWAMIFLAAGEGVADRDGLAARPWDRVYFAGYSVFTLGNGEFMPVGPVWQLATVLASLTGLTLVSLAIAYVVLVTSAATDRHAAAVQLSLLGRTPVEIVQRWWASRADARFDDLVGASGARIVELTHRHLAYPVLHFFHARQASESPPMTIAVLDDALTLILCGVDADEPSPVLEVTRAAIDGYLDTVAHYVDRTARAVLPQLSTDALAGAGVPVVPASSFNRDVARLAGRRATLYGLVAAEGFGPTDDG